MSGRIAVRAAGAADLAVITDIFSRSRRTLSFLPGLHTGQEDFVFWRDVVMADQAVSVGLVDDRIAGVMATAPGWIHHLYVDPVRMGRGVGSALVRDAQARMREIALWCFAANHGARRLYERHGFVAVEQTDGSGNAERTPDVRYVWRRS